MAITLIGTVVNNCDAATGFIAGNVSGDDPFVQGTGSVGNKVSATTTEMYTTSLTSGPYNFSSGGGQFGYHIIMWMNAKSPIDATSGFQIVVGNGTSRGRWYTTESSYTGGFVPKVVNTARNFDIIAAGTWTTNGNPGQLSSITQMGPAFTTSTSIMGSFNNVNVDQFTIGFGLRADAGTVGTPNTFETVRAADESGTVWGWWTSRNGAYVGRGKLYIGPSTGSATSVFTDSTKSIVFADERVATGFYEINVRGSGTDVTWSLLSIAAANPTNARWSIIIASGSDAPNSFSDSNSLFRGADQITLQSTATLTGTTLVNCTKLTQNSATLSGIQVLSANNSSGVAFILANNLSLISGSTFTFSAGHAIEIATSGTYSFSGNKFNNYGANGTNTAAIYNNCTPTTLNSYAETNQSGTTSLRTGSTTAIGQSFASGSGGQISEGRFYLKKTGSPTGNAVAKIYAHSGTLGTSSVPTGSALATSDNFDVSTLTTSYALTSIKFSGTNAITLSASTNYVLVIEYSGGSVGNTLDVGTDTTSPTHPGNASTFNGTWTAVSGTDVCFYLYTGGAVIINITNGGGTPTVRNALGCSTKVNNAVSLSVTVKNNLGSPIQNVRVAIYKVSDNSEILNSLTDVNGQVSSSYAYTSNEAIYIRARKTSTGNTRYFNNDSSGTITSTGFSSTITMLTDTIASA